jgi:hypothetical protein
MILIDPQLGAIWTPIVYAPPHARRRLRPRRSPKGQIYSGRPPRSGGRDPIS